MSVEPTQPEVSSPPPPGGVGRGPRWALSFVLVAAAVAGMVVAAAGLGFFGAAGTSTPTPVAGSSAITRTQLAQEYGIRLNLVGVTAAGGLVDLRFTITDVAKAKKLFDNPSVMPAVIAEPTGTVLQAPHGGHHGHIVPTDGASYFVLIGNAGGAVQRGVPVSVLINGVRVEHIAAES